MKAILDHAAFATQDLEKSVDFFEKVFGMTVERTSGEAPNRKVWFDQGVQLNETEFQVQTGNQCDHICLKVSDRAEATKKAIECGGAEIKENWIRTPDGIVIELYTF